MEFSHQFFLAVMVELVEFYLRSIPVAEAAYPQVVFYPQFFAAAVAAFYHPSFPVAMVPDPRSVLVATAA